MSLTEIAGVFGVDTDTIHIWRSRGMPHRTMSNRPRFEVGLCVQWRREQDKREARESASPDEAKERARKLAADADLAELRVLEKRGELISAVEVERGTERMVATIKSRILGMRARWAPRLLGLSTMAEATAIADQMSHDMLASLAEGADDVEAEEAA